MAYRADIEIGVKGIQQLQAVTKQINTLAIGVDGVNKRLGSAAQSINTYNANLAKAAATLNKVNAGTIAEADAVRQYVQALGQANAARDRQNKLIQEQIALQRKAVPTANAGFGVQGPALPPGTSAAARRGGGGVGGRIGGAVSGAVIGGAFPLLFGQSGGAAAGGAAGGLVGGLIGPGGSFAGSLLGTLIGDIASRGQAVKDLGKDIGFSVEQTNQLAVAFKTANTDVEKFTAVIQNIRGLGLELEDQAKAIQLVTTLTEKYGGSFEKTGNAITSALESGKVTQATLNQLTSQGINIQGELADKYGVSRDAILAMAKDGDVSVQTLVDTLVEMGNEGVTAATKPKTAMERLTASVNTLGQSLSTLATKLVQAFGPALQWLTDRLTDFVNAISRAVSRLSDLMNGGRMAQAEIQAARAAENATRDKFGVLGGIRAFNPAAQKFYEQQKQTEMRRLAPGAFAASTSAAPLTSFQVPSQAAPTDGGGGGATGPKPPEDRTQQLIEEFNAVVAIAKAQDTIRDLLADGQEVRAAEVELTAQLADIERDRNKALLNANYETEKTVISNIAQARILDAQLQTEDKIRAIKQQQFEKELGIAEAVRSSVQAFTDLRKQQETQLQYAKTYSRLIMEGMLPQEAQRLANFEQLVNTQLKAVEAQIVITQAAIVEGKARGLSVEKLQEELDLLKQKKNAIEDAAAPGPGAGPTDTERLQDAITTVRGELNNLTDPINQVIAGAKAIGDAFHQAFTGLVSGAMTGQEALAAFFKGVGDHFLDMASKMIAKLIEIYILEKVVGFITGAVGGGGGGGGLGGVSTTGVPSYALPSGGGFSMFAAGGFVTGPTRAVVGEGGEPEYVIPASKMRGAMSRYAAGARGASVIPGSGASGGGPMGGGGGGAIDVRYTVERINSVDYVTADQFQRGMAQAAQQGAVQGEQRAMRSLKTSAATRRSVGI